MPNENAVEVIQKPNYELEPTKAVSILDKLMDAAQNGMPIETIEKFMELAERNQKREAENAYHRAFAAFKANPPKIVKDKLVGFGNTKYKHATIGNVVSSIIEGMSRHGLSHCWPITQNGNSITVTCKITHEVGHSESTALTSGADTSGGKNAIQAIGSTVTYLQRYTLQAATGIAVLETDDDGGGHKEPVVDAAYWQNKLDREAKKDLAGIKTWKAKSFKSISKMADGQEKTDALNYIEDMIEEYTPAKKEQSAKTETADRTFIDKCLPYLNSEAVSKSLDSFMVAWSAYIKDHISKLPEDQQKELIELKTKIETKFQGDK